jgi:hypothetical protein
MIGADDGTSIGDSKNLLFDKAELHVVGRSSEQLVDRSVEVGLMILKHSGFSQHLRLI